MEFAMIWAGPILACAAAGATGSLFRPGAWYEGLEKPSWTPPKLAFPIVWTALYILMAAAAIRGGLALAEGQGDGGQGDAARGAAGLAFWAAQITLNALWSPVFFGLRRPRLALGIIVALWLCVAGAAWGLGGVDSAAGWMMAPSLVWIAVAAGLNLSVLRRNPASVFISRFDG